MIISRPVKESQVAGTQLDTDAGPSCAALHSWVADARAPRSESLHPLAAGLTGRAEVLQELTVQLEQAAGEAP